MTKKIAFKGGFLIDGIRDDAVADSLVLVEEGKIAFAGEAAGAPVTPQQLEAEWDVRDITGKTIMPGLVDTHLHFSGNLNDCDQDWVLEDNLQKCVVAVQQAHECLEAGLTTVGEISRFGIHIRNMIEQKVMTGPRVVASGLGFCATSSHGDSHTLSVEQNHDAHPWAECVDGPWDLRKAIRRRMREDPDAIKIWATGGGIWRWDTAYRQHYTMEEVQAIADECKLQGIPLWSHCFGSAYNSVVAGADFIIHGFNLDEKTLDLMTEKGIALCPTIHFMPDWYETYPPQYDPELHDKYPGDTLKEKEMNRIYDNLKNAAGKGITLTIGSDSFCSQLTPYGETAIRELHAFVDKAGIGVMETLKAATINGARVLLVDDVTGSLEAGKSADLLVVEGNVLEDIHNLTQENIRLVMKEGEIV